MTSDLTAETSYQSHNQSMDNNFNFSRETVADSFSEGGSGNLMETKVTPLEKFSEVRAPTPTHFLTTLKSKVGNADLFNQFEQFLNTQNRELLFVKKNCDHLRTVLNKSQEDRRALELQLVAERAHRDHETKNAQTAIENNTIQLKAQIYAIKFEKETWKQKTESTAKETQLLKEQLKLVEAEKTEATKNLAEITEKGACFDNFRKSFELYAMRIQDTIQDLTRQLSELQFAREEQANILKTFQDDVNVLNVYVKTQAEHIKFMEQRANALENELVKRRQE